MATLNAVPRRWRAASAIAAATLAASMLAGCGSSSNGDGSGAASITNQTWIVPQDWGALDPTRVAATNTGAILLIMEPLVLADADGGVSANLAELAQPDPKTYVFTLRSDAKFTDGNPVTAEDVAYSYDIHARKESKSSLNANFANVDSMEATADGEFTIKLKTPDVLFENTLAQVGIVEKSVREKYGDDAGSPDKLNVGSGPYVVDKYTPGSELVLKQNADYWGDKPAAESLTLKVIPDESNRLLAVQSGEVTGAFEIPASQAESYSAANGMKLISGANPSIMMFNVNTTIAPWNDVHVRKAVGMAIDKQGIIDAVLKGKGDPESVVVSNQSLGDVLDKSAVDALTSELETKHDLTAAKAELAKSASPDGFKGEVIYSEVESNSGLVAQAVASQLKELGIELKVKAAPDGQYTDAVFFNHTAPAAIVDFTTDLPDPISLPNYLTSSKQTLAKGGYTNIAEWTSPDQDKILDTYLATPSTDSETRAQLLTDALKNMSADQAYIPIYNAEYLAVVKSGLKFEGFDGMWWMRRWVDDITAE